MLLGISFLEAPLKFQVPNITMKTAVGVGQVVFRALNKVEIAFSAITLTMLYVNKQDFNPSHIIILLVIVFVIIIQSIYLLPVLDERATQILNGEKPERSYYHLYYVVCEVMKVVLLIISFINLYPDE